MNRRIAPSAGHRSPDVPDGTHHHASARPRVVDPVCRMTFPFDLAVATATHAGRTVYFCSAVCQERFAEDPAYFVRLASGD